MGFTGLQNNLINYTDYFNFQYNCRLRPSYVNVDIITSIFPPDNGPTFIEIGKKKDGRKNSTKKNYTLDDNKNHSEKYNDNSTDTKLKNGNSSFSLTWPINISTIFNNNTIYESALNNINRKKKSNKMKTNGTEDNLQYKDKGNYTDNNNDKKTKVGKNYMKIHS